MLIIARNVDTYNKFLFNFYNEMLVNGIIILYSGESFKGLILESFVQPSHSVVDLLRAKTVWQLTCDRCISFEVYETNYWKPKRYSGKYSRKI